MDMKNSNILTVNGGSSSIRFAIYEMTEYPDLKFSGKIDRIGAADFQNAARKIIDSLREKPEFESVKCIGHRIVHGLRHTQPQIIDEDLLSALDRISSFDPDHLPSEIRMIRLFKEYYPELLQVACFDTAFHTTIPVVASMFAIPRRYYEEGVQRYGFHGISYSFLMEEMEKRAGEKAAGRIILAHLGSGASLAAVLDGKCMDTTMGFTPAGGIAMGTRSGDIDPGVASYMMKQGLNAGQFNDMINHRSGLLGISQTSSDMQELLQKENNDPRAREAISLFSYQVKKCIGAFAAILGGLDAIVFSGGIGENAPTIRARICDNLHYLGIELKEEANNRNTFQISTQNSPVAVYVIPANEEVMIARSTTRIYNQSNYKPISH